MGIISALERWREERDAERRERNRMEGSHALLVRPFSIPMIKENIYPPLRERWSDGEKTERELERRRDRWERRI